MSVKEFLIITRNGLLAAYLSSGLSKSDFKNQLKPVLDESRIQPPIQPDPSSNGPTSDQGITIANETEVGVEGESTETPHEESNSKPSTTGSVPPQGEKDEDRETIDSQRIDYVKKQKMREQSQKAERARIMQQIQNDREEWKRREKMRQGEEVELGGSSVALDAKSGSKQSKQSQSGQCRIQVRLRDGSTIRSSFTGDQTIGNDVRKWIDEQMGDANFPYTLKQVLTPLPNKTISDTEEEESLRYLALGPSATLVMVPVKSYTDAYVEAGPGLISRGIWGGYGLVSSALGTVYGGVSTILGFWQAPAAPTSTEGNSPNNSGGPTTSSGIKIKTLADQRRERGDQQFYNGNQVSVPEWHSFIRDSPKVVKFPTSTR
jgi:hypothetical protein